MIESRLIVTKRTPPTRRGMVAAEHQGVVGGGHPRSLGDLPDRLRAYDPRLQMARQLPMLIPLGYGKFVRADRVYALVPLGGADRGVRRFESSRDYCAEGRSCGGTT